MFLFKVASTSMNLLDGSVLFVGILPCAEIYVKRLR